MKLLLSLLSTLLCAYAMAVHGSAGPYQFDIRTNPEIVPVGRAKLLLTVTDSAGKPALNATVKVLTQMPGMPMGEREETASPGATPGAYIAPAVFGMAGSYDVKVSISGPLGLGQTNLNLSTGESSQSAGRGLSPTIAAVFAIVVLGIAFVLFQIRKSGQKANLKAIFNRQVAVSIILLGVALAVSVWAVNTFRRPGSMTPLEAQVMEMNAPAPEGALPVNLAKVESKPFGATVTYTGQALGFVEQDVIARISGAIVWMPYYVGDKVTKGQVLAKLDTTAIDPMVNEKMAQTQVASRGVDIAQSDYRRALAEVSQAEAEQAMKESEIAEAKSMVTASKEAQVSAEANLRMEQSSVVDAQSQVASAQADRDYWVQELIRSKQLFGQGAISKDELQKTQASASSAQAKVRQANAGVNGANARVQAARAAIAKAVAEVQQSVNKLQGSQAEHHVHMAHVLSARAAAESAKKRISQAGSEVDMANSGLRGATTQRGYAELRSDVDGVITARVISPGVVVGAGQSVLKVAQISPIRLQANVPQADLARIQVGDAIKVKRKDVDETPLLMTVASVSPSIDPNSRTGVVEALYANQDGRFRPGQFISMEISIGGSQPALVVPSDSVQTDEDRSYIWIAESSTNNQYTVSRHEVKLGSRSGDRVAVVSGVRAGQFVVTAPPQGLSAGMLVTSAFTETAKVDDAAKAEQTIEITAAGYSPPSIRIPSDKPLKLTFIRRDDKTCGTEVIFPDLGIRKALPLNQPVTIDIPAQPAGKELNFTCPMNMLNGKAVAK